MSEEKIIKYIIQEPQISMNDGEIDLIDILLVIWRRKILGLAVAAIVVIAGIVYLEQIKPIYEVATTLLVSKDDLSSLEPLDPDNNALFNNKEILNIFAQRLSTTSFKKEYFYNSLLKDVNYLSDKKTDFMDKALFDEFSNSVTITKSGEALVVRMQGVEKEYLANWLDDMVVKANKILLQELIETKNARINNKINKLQNEIEIKRSMAKLKIQDEISILQDQYSIADKLNIHENLFVNAVVKKEFSGVTVNNVDSPNYMKGTKILSAEISSLKEHVNNDVYVVGFRDLQEAILKLQDSIVSMSDIYLFEVDMKASDTQATLIKPKRRLALALILIFGILSGLTVIVLSELRKKIIARSS